MWIKMKKKPQPKSLVVINTQTVTPNMQRITLQGEALGNFPQDCEGSYIKLLFNETGGTDIQGFSEENRPVMRTYTIRRFDPQACTMKSTSFATLLKTYNVDLQRAGRCPQKKATPSISPVLAVSRT